MVTNVCTSDFEHSSTNMRLLTYSIGTYLQLASGQEPEPEAEPLSKQRREEILAGNFNTHATFRPNIRRHKVLDDPNRWFNEKGKLPERYKKKHPKRPSKAEFLADFRKKINATNEHLRDLLLENHRRTEDFRSADSG